ncbi:MORN repeat-containing protein 4-like [Anneissia japonica]|uniref:MORN repeat-containing protein 4-like n=1 Tax=Anneissia japonica TaxID=1529436 RepID=UPI00142584C7|nr:MORN repeat-containing protein 4-like [Anneissia japonica]
MTSKQGTYTYPEGDEYRGEWLEGKRHGVGHLRLRDGSTYTGHFEHGLSSGTGVMVFSDGSRYEGEFVQGKFHGMGVFTRSDGMVFEGEFVQGCVQGGGLLTFADGTNGMPRNEGIWEGNRMAERQKCNQVVAKARQNAAAARAIHVS